MAKRNVIWTKTADLQFLGVLEYWVNRNKSNQYSKKLLKMVVEKTKRIAQHPHIYKATDFKDVRVAFLQNYSIYFIDSQTSIIITAFWDNRQNPNDLLNILKGIK